MLSAEVTSLVQSLNHPLAKGIRVLREMCDDITSEMEEDVKWNGPNFKHKGKDRITLRVSSPKLIQVILHLGAKTERMPEVPLLEKSQKFIEIKGNDRVILTFKSNEEVLSQQEVISGILQKWVSLSENH